MSTQNANAVAITGGTIAGAAITGGTIASLATDLAVADGGTSSSTFTANSVVLGNGTSALNANMVAPSTTGNLLTSNGTTWVSANRSKDLTGNFQLFSSNGTFTVPTGVVNVVAYVIGGGGSGGTGSSGGPGDNGYTGGSSSFGSYITCAGGYGGAGATLIPANGGQPGAAGGTPGGTHRQNGIANLAQSVVFGVGGGGGAGYGAGEYGTAIPGSAGGTNYAVVGLVTGLTPGGTVSVTVGAGGAAVGGGGAGTSGAGNAGAVLVAW
jgi:hypothetical protein